MGRLLPTAVGLLLVAGCGTSELLGPDAAQGVEGTVLLGPQCPVQSQQNPCPDQPYQAWIAVRTAIGVPVTRIHSGEDGRFRVGLEPGPYVLDPDDGNPFPIASEVDVVVRESVYSEVVISFDTGIR